MPKLRPPSIQALAFATLSLAALGCARAPAEDAPPVPGQEAAAAPDLDAVRRAMADVDARWEDAANRGDAAGVAGLYAGDGVLLPPNADVVRGPDAIRAFVQGYVDAGMTNVDFTALDVGASGDLAYEVGRYTYDLATPEGEITASDRGKYLIVARRQADGSWKLVADMFNTSLPAPGGR